MAGHPNNGDRSYLANEVRAQRDDITKLGDKVADVDKRLERQTVALSTLIEDGRRAREHRNLLWGTLNAMRGELQQNTMATANAQGSLESARKMIADQGVTLKEHETERQRRAAVMELAKAISKPAWAILCALAVVAIGAGSFIAALFHK